MTAGTTLAPSDVNSAAPPPPRPSERIGLRAKLINGVLGTTVGFGAQKLVQLISNLLLTRMLFPEAFGLMAIANVFIIGMYMLSDVGIRPAIVQMDRAHDHTFLNTAWTVQVVRGFVLFGILCAISFPAAHIYDQPELTPILCFMGISTIVGGFRSIGVDLADRKLMVWRTIWIKFIGQLAGTLSMLALAWYYKSVWSLAIGTVVGMVAEIIAGYFLCPKHPHRFAFDRGAARDLFRFGKWILLATLFNYIGGHGMRAIEGVLVPVATVGFITIAATFAFALIDLSNQFMARLIFPALSIYNREQPVAFAATLSRMRRPMLLAFVPAFGVLAMISNPMIELLYDDRYHVAGPMLAILAVNGALALLPSMYQQALLARGDTRTHFILITITMVLRLVGMVTGYYLGGVFAMLAGAGVASVLVYLAAAFIAHRNGYWSPLTDTLCLAGIAAFAAAAFHFNVIPYWATAPIG